MLIPVTKDSDNKTELIMLDIDDVIYVQVEGRYVVYHTLNDHFYHWMPSLSTLENKLEPSGFQRLDRINIVNMNKIEYFDEEYSKVYFQPKEKIDKSSKFATVALIKKKLLKNRKK